MNQILTLAQEHELAGKMSSNQAYYVQGWVAGAVAIAYLKVRETGTATPQQSETISAWLQSIGKQTIGYYEEHKKSGPRSEEHTSELQSHLNLVCRLLLEKKKCRRI